MMCQTTLWQSDDGVAVTIPAEMLERLQLKDGDRVLLRETSEGILLTPFDPEFAEAMAVFERGARKFEDALLELGKR